MNPSLLLTPSFPRSLRFVNPTPLALTSVSRYFPPAVAKTYVVTFRSHNDDRPSKFIVLADGRKEAIQMAWEHGGPAFQARFDKSTAQAEEMKEGGAARCDSGSTKSRREQAMKSFLYNLLRWIVWTLIAIAAMVAAFVVGRALGNYFKPPPAKDPYCVGLKC